MEETDRTERRDGEGCSDHPSEILVSCTWCEKLHRTGHPLDFDPICATCAARDSIMRALGMHGPLQLSNQAIDEALTRTAPGNYALGYMDGETFVVLCVGRSDSDLRGRLHEWVGAASHYDRHAPAYKAPWSSRRRAVRPMGEPVPSRVGNCVASSYTSFAYSYASCADTAFDKECRNYQRFGGNRKLDNETPPARDAFRANA
jgi:hypothetical protein